MHKLIRILSNPNVKIIQENSNILSALNAGKRRWCWKDFYISFI